MRYFWAEDFNEDRDETGKLEEKFRSYFDLPVDKTINKRDLNSMISYLEEKKNFRKIDAFLVDIRFPVSESDTEKVKDEIYNKYYKEFITLDMYNNNIDEAPGLLLYLLLVFRYHVPLTKIVFISAHISDDNDLLQHLNDMKEFMYKRQVTNLLDSDVKKYRGCANRLVDPFFTKYHVFKDKSEVAWMSTNNPDANDVIKRLNQLKIDYPEYFKTNRDGDGTLQQYKLLSKQFSDMGLSMPLAFEKPKPSGVEIDKKYSFIHWEKMSDLEHYNAIRSAIQEMSLIIIEKLEKKMYRDFIKILTCEEYEIETYDDIFFKNYLEQIMDLLPLECSSDEEALSAIVVKEIASVWENVALPKYTKEEVFNKRAGEKQRNSRNKWEYYHKDPCFYASHSVMKIVRNWSGHQGIKGIGIIDLGWIFVLSMRGIFDLEELEDRKEEYIQYEKRILSLLKKEDVDVVVDVELSKEYFAKLNEVTIAPKKVKSDDIYERISGLGNAGSKIRLEVAMDEIYMLYYHTILKGLFRIGKEAQEGCYKSEYEYICESINVRTWYAWKERYDNRFGVYHLVENTLKK